MKRMMTIAILPLLLLGAWATTNTAEQRASCEEMERDMGLGTTHDHAEMNGVGRNPMNLTHERCQQILAQTQ